MGMLNLTVALSGKIVKKYTLGDDRKAIIGRASECDIVIDNLGVSRSHCELFWAGHCWVLQDLHSNNGTFVNGKKVPTHNVNDGDEITLGKFKLTCEVPQDELEFDVEPPVKIPGYGEATLSIEGRKQGLKDQVKVKGYLAIEGAGRRTIVLDKTAFVIGRAETADLKVPGILTRPKHALIIRDEAGFMLVDVSGKSKTFLNESPIDAERLKDGDVIRVRSKTFKFVVGTPNY